jgi:hypothetical protein
MSENIEQVLELGCTHAEALLMYDEYQNRIYGLFLRLPPLPCPHDLP